MFHGCAIETLRNNTYRDDDTYANDATWRSLNQKKKQNIWEKYIAKQKVVFI